jgi:hypothetical protein
MPSGEPAMRQASPLLSVSVKFRRIGPANDAASSPYFRQNLLYGAELLSDLIQYPCLGLEEHPPSSSDAKQRVRCPHAFKGTIADVA